MPTPEQIVASAKPGSSVVGWKLAADDRARLLGKFPPTYPDSVADHVTLKPRVAQDTPVPPAVEARIVGRADDDRGVEAMVVEIDGRSHRPGGGTYHITWSLAPGRKARESNDAIAAKAWTPFAEPVPVQLRPACFR